MAVPPRGIEPTTAILATADFALTFTNLGARPLHQHILQPARYQARGDLLSYLQTDQGPHNPTLPFDVSLKSLAPGLETTSPFELVPPASADPEAHFRWTSADNRFQVDKIYRPGPTPYSVKLEIQLTNRSETPLTDDLTLSMWGQQDPKREPSFFEPTAPIEAVCFTDDDTERSDSSDDDPEPFEDAVRWIAIDDVYFVYAATGEQWRRCELLGLGKQGVRASVTRSVTVGAGQTSSVVLDLYLGPKEDKALEAFGQGIDKTINYGWVEFLAKPLHWLLVQLHGLFQSWGLAIIALTMLIRGLLWPVTQRSQDSMMAMRDLSPKIKELQEKYADNPMMLQQQQLALFKEHNVNPFGCLPLFLQIPIWFSLYRTIYASAELFQTEFLWIKDLSSPDPYYILPTVVGILFFVQQATSGTSTDPKQKIIMYVMTGLFVVFMFVWPAGLNVYILVSTLIGIIQTLFSRRRYDALKLKRAAAADAAAALDTSSSAMAAAAAATPIGSGSTSDRKKRK